MSTKNTLHELEEGRKALLFYAVHQRTFVYFEEMREAPEGAGSHVDRIFRPAPALTIEG